jgi:hypothetical protein
MSRARHASHVYTAAGDLREAAERLSWSWDQERREQWASDRRRAAGRIEALQAERQRLVATVPPDVSAQLARVRQEQSAIERDLAHLRAGTGRWLNTPVGDAHYQLLATQSAHRQAQRRAEAQGIFGRRRARQDVEASLASVEESKRAMRRASEPHARGLLEQQASLADELSQLEARQQARAEFIDANPGVTDRIVEIDRAVQIEQASERRSRAAPGAAPLHPHRRSAGVAYEAPRTPEPAQPYGPSM